MAISDVFGFATVSAFLSSGFAHRLLHVFLVLLSYSMFVFFLERRKLFVLRLVLCLVGYAALAMVVSEFFAMYVPRLSMLSILAVSVFIIPVCFKCNAWEVLFCVVSASIVQNLAYNVGSLVCVMCGLPLDIGNWASSLVQAVAYTAVLVVCYIICARKWKGSASFSVERIPIVLLAALSVVVVYVVQYDQQDYMSPDFYAWRTVFICYAITALFMLFGMYEQLQLKNQNYYLQQLIVMSQKQYELLRKNIELVNIKCHDIKHQINNWGEMTDEQRRQSFDDIKQSIMIYESIAKTGNAALDTVLTSNSLSCERHQIKIAYMVDGEKLGFISSADIYSLFGNAFENAIESVRHQTDKSRRLINLNVTSKSGMLYVYMENPCDSQLKFVDGLPVTTKDDLNYHGFGMKSMRYIVEKYNGVMNADVRDGMFFLDIVIPIPTTEETEKSPVNRK